MKSSFSGFLSSPIDLRHHSFNELIMTNQSASEEGASVDLTAIKWAHAVNSVSLLKNALNSKLQSENALLIGTISLAISIPCFIVGDVHMIEADILMGTLHSDGDALVPIMAHPPNTSSDLSLEAFMKTILVHNNEHPDSIKGVKLDFKSIESFNGSLDLLKSIWHQVVNSSP